MDSAFGWIMNWWWVTVLGPVILLAALAYAVMMRRRLSPRERTEQREAVKSLYDDGDPDGRGAGR